MTMESGFNYTKMASFIGKGNKSQPFGGGREKGAEKGGEEYYVLFFTSFYLK